MATWKYASFTTGFTPEAGGLSGLPIPAINDLSLFGSFHPPLIENEVETLIRLEFFDNVAIATQTGVPPIKAPSFTITGPDAASLYFKGGMPTVTLTGGPMENHRVRTLFRNPGVYKVSAEVWDTARNFSGGEQPNVRQLEFGLIIVPTTMDIRVIDRETIRR